MNDLTLSQSRALTAVDVRTHVNLIQEVMKLIMKVDTHYGTIPGCKQPTLYKAGSEVLLTTFRIAVSLRVEDLSTDDEIRYRVYATGTHQLSGIIVGEGVGECSSGEEKYKWRKAVCIEEFEETPENRRRIKFQKGAYVNNRYDKYAIAKIEQVRTDPADLANTVLKMAKKRAQIDLTLTATAASDIFTQDVEDIPEELRETAAEYEEVGQPVSKSAKQEQKQPTEPVKAGTYTGEAATEGMKKTVRRKMEDAALTEIDMKAKFGFGVDDMPGSAANDVLDWVKNPV